MRDGKRQPLSEGMNAISFKRLLYIASLALSGFAGISIFEDRPGFTLSVPYVYHVQKDCEDARPLYKPPTAGPLDQYYHVAVLKRLPPDSDRFLLYRESWDLAVAIAF